jgi:O-antigen biosynthesis protein WbqP
MTAVHHAPGRLTLFAKITLRSIDRPNMIRVFDIIFSLLGLIFGFPVLLIILAIGYLDTGSPVFLQKRVGRHKREFVLIKFRTMKTDTVSIASHQVNASAVTKIGKILRRTKLDELPQLINVVCGQMSLVGPRPCLPSQSELIIARDAAGVYRSRPGITGVAQLNNIDMSTPQLLAQTDASMIEKMSLKLYFRCIVLTALGKGGGDRVLIK